MKSSYFKYKNISEQKQTLIGYGEVEPEEIIEVEQPISNPNFRLQVDIDNKVGVVPVTKAQKGK